MLAPRLCDRLVANNALHWKAIQAFILITGLLLVMTGYGEYARRAEILYVHPLWWRQLTALLMLPAFILFIASYFPGGINRHVRHPQLMAVILWAAGHLLMDGSVADVMLFGTFLIWALAGYVFADKRDQGILPHRFGSTVNTLVTIITGLLLYALFYLWLHEWLIGVRPLIRINH